jgi:hypothetical protein
MTAGNGTPLISLFIRGHHDAASRSGVTPGPASIRHFRGDTPTKGDDD